MLRYYLRLALNSFARTPGLTILMACAIALGIAACVITLTVHRAMSANPIAAKNDRLFTVTMDAWDPNKPPNEDQPELPPPQLTSHDATHLFTSDIPARKVIMYPVAGVLLGGASEHRPVRARTRVTSADFFPMFDVPFEYGSGWGSAADNSPAPVIVLSHFMNQKLFGGENSVGRTVRWNDREFRIIGVLAEWLPMPRFYDLNGSPFAAPEDAYVPWGWGTALELLSSGNILCWKSEKVDTFRAFIGSECNWIQMWVELPNERARERMQVAMDAYWAQQHAAGRFERPMNNRLTNVSDWLKQSRVVPDDNRLLVVLSFLFLAVCLVNTVGLLLAKFLSAAGLSGVRRALGATQRDIFRQHLVEVSMLAGVGALLGLAFGTIGLWGVRTLYSNAPGERGGYEQLAHLDLASIGWVALLAILAALAAGLYPAWRIGRLDPSLYLKRQ
jgi:putative ABC transport system permease protein